MAKHLDFNDLLAEYRLLGDDGDPGGECRAWWFTVAAELYHGRGVGLPLHWQYSPGSGNDNRPGDYRTSAVLDATDDALLAFGNFLSRYGRLLRAAGKSY